MPNTYTPIYPTPAHLSAIRSGAYNDLTREIERCGVRLSHDEADEIGGDVGRSWLTGRLGLHLVTDDRGTMFLPRE